MIDYGIDVKLDYDIPLEALEWRNDRKIFDTCRQYTLINKDDHFNWIKSLENNKSLKMFSIVYLNKYVGVCGLTNINWQARHAEISLYIDSCERGKNLGIKTLFLLCEHGFKDFNLNKLWGEVFNNNIASLKIFKRLGFIATPGHIQHYYRNGQYIDTTFMSILASDWEHINLIKNIKEKPCEDIFIELGKC